MRVAYQLVAQNGDSLAVPQLVITRLPELDNDRLRVALYLLATGNTDEEQIATALRLRSSKRAHEALLYWQGAGLLTVCDSPQLQPTVRRLNSAEVSRAAQSDAQVAALVQEAQTLLGSVISPGDVNVLASLYLVDGLPVEVILLGVAHFAARGKRNVRYIERALLSWQRDGIDTVSTVESYLQQLATREKNEARVAVLFGMPQAKFTASESRYITEWYEGFGYDDAMITEAIGFAGEKRSVRYVNGILRGWYGKGYKTLRDVMQANAGEMHNVQTSNPHAQNILSGGRRRAPTFKKEDKAP